MCLFFCLFVSVLQYSFLGNISRQDFMSKKVLLLVLALSFELIDARPEYQFFSPCALCILCIRSHTWCSDMSWRQEFMLLSSMMQVLKSLFVCLFAHVQLCAIFCFFESKEKKKSIIYRVVQNRYRSDGSNTLSTACWDTLTIHEKFRYKPSIVYSWNGTNLQCLTVANIETSFHGLLKYMLTSEDAFFYLFALACSCP